MSSFSLSARKALVCWCSMLAMPAVVFCQSSFVRSGNEYSITGILPGDQVHPGLSITTNGGYIVWEDNCIDGKGLGVGAMRLKSDFTGTHVPFRVNSLGLGDQESGQVSMLNDGGAVFAWQGGKQGFQHIYSRFLSSSNNWINADLLVNAVTNRFQSSPVIATLLNGNVVIVYVSRDQAAPGSMSDVYLQMFAPDGSKVGGEILVNQFTANNQRSPAVTALADGRFVVAWISEQERWTDASNGAPSVDVFGRFFDAAGNAGSDEFLLNVSGNFCGYPDLAAAPDGGFMAAWMERDLAVRNNGWDIYARRFTSAGVGGNVTRVNTQLYGDQYSPKVRRAGSTYLEIWTSLGQDGSREGVFGRYLNDDATVSGTEFQVNSTVAGPQREQVLGTDGAGRFLAAWTSFGVGVNGYDLYGQKFADPSVASLGSDNSVFNSNPNNNPNSVSDSAPGENPLPTPVPVPVPVPVTNTFNDVKGIYNGLIYDPNNPVTANSGYITITTTAKGSFSAKLQMAGQKYSFSGMFDASGASTVTVGSFKVNLLLDLHGGDMITGQIVGANWTAALQANLNVFGKTKPATVAGTYTMIAQPSEGVTGIGIGTAKVDSSGNVTWNMTLSDGTKLSSKTTLSKTGSWPLYAAPYSSKGVMVGWMQFGTNSADGFDGQSVWQKPSGTPAPYASGLTNGISVYGALYKAPPLGFRAFGNSKIVLNGGGLPAPITNSVTWGIDNKIVSEKTSASMKLSLTSSTGLFKGTVTDPVTGNAVSFQGVLFEKNNVGLGFFLGGIQSGEVNFAPNP
jgi:hypothetical protein